MINNFTTNLTDKTQGETTATPSKFPTEHHSAFLRKVQPFEDEKVEKAQNYSHIDDFSINEFENKTATTDTYKMNSNNQAYEVNQSEYGKGGINM